MSDEDKLTITLSREHYHAVVLAVADAATFYANSLDDGQMQGTMSDELIEQGKFILTTHLEALKVLDVEDAGIFQAFTDGRDQALATKRSKLKEQADNLADVIDINSLNNEGKEVDNEPTNESEEHNSDGPEGEPDSSS